MNKFITVSIDGIPTKISLNKVIKAHKCNDSSLLCVFYEYGSYVYEVGKGEMDFPVIDGFIVSQTSAKSLMVNLDCVKMISLRTNAYATVSFHDNLEVPDERIILDEEMTAVISNLVAPSAILSVLPPKV